MATEAPEAPVQDTPQIVVETPANPAKGEATPLWKSIKLENPANPAPKKPEETPEVKPEDKAAPETQKPQESAPKSGKEESLANLRKKLEDQTKELEEFRTKYSTVEKEYNEYKQKPFELPEEHKARVEALEQERNTYAKELKAAKLERDPEFQSKYQKNIESHVQLMTKIAVEAGISEAEVKAGMGSWNEDTFGAWAEQMTPGQKTKFSAAWIKSEELWNERQQAINNAEQTWTDMQKARELEAKSQYEAGLSQNEKLAKSVLKELILDNEGYKEFEDLPGKAEDMVLKAARYELTPKEVFQHVAASQALARVNVKLNDTVKAKDATIAELQQKLAEQESFIKDHAGSTPSPNATGSIAGKEKSSAAPLWNVQIRQP